MAKSLWTPDHSYPRTCWTPYAFIVMSTLPGLLTRFWSVAVMISAHIATRALVRSRQWYQVRRPEAELAFQIIFIPKVFGGLEVRALCRPLMFINNKHCTNSLHAQTHWYAGTGSGCFLPIILETTVYKRLTIGRNVEMPTNFWPYIVNYRGSGWSVVRTLGYLPVGQGFKPQQAAAEPLRKALIPLCFSGDVLWLTRCSDTNLRTTWNVQRK